jgi:hypothetical protein
MLEKVKKYKFVSALLSAAFLFVIGGFLWAWFSLGKTANPLIMHFDNLHGITTATGRGTILFAGIFGLAAVMVNAYLALEFEERNPLFGKLTAVLTLVLAVLLFIAFAAILSVN